MLKSILERVKAMGKGVLAGDCSDDFFSICEEVLDTKPCSFCNTSEDSIFTTNASFATTQSFSGNKVHGGNVACTRPKEQLSTETPPQVMAITVVNVFGKAINVG